jgi:hypothetical protein
MGPRDEDYHTEYARFAINSRGIPEDFETWVSEMVGRANKSNSKKKASRPKKMRTEDDS